MARKSTGAVLFGALLIVIWGVEVIRSIALLTHPIDTSNQILADYASTVNTWLLARIAVAVLGIVAGILVYQGRRLGHWLSVASAATLLLLLTDWGWFKMLLPGVIHSSPFTFFFVKSPALGYAVIIVPVVATVFLGLSATSLVKHRRSKRAI